jgi:uncharacterized protein (TIGR04255 family)
MNFKPVNDDHSIVETVFKIELENGIPIPNLRSLADAYNDRMTLTSEHQSRANSLRDDLPFFRIHEDQHVGVLLGRVRPDGDSSWRLSVAADEVNQIKITCKSYTRWAKVWDKFEKHLVDAIALLMLGNEQSGPDERKMPDVTGVGLSVLDRFIVDRSSATEFAPHKYLLKQSKYLPDCLIENPEYFSSDIRMKPFGAAHVERLNVSSVANYRLGDDSSLLDIRHELEIHDLKLDLSNVAFFMDTIRPRVNELHKQNKTILAEILTDKAQNSVLLNVESGS